MFGFSAAATVATGASNSAKFKWIRRRTISAPNETQKSPTSQPGKTLLGLIDLAAQLDLLMLRRPSASPHVALLGAVGFAEPDVLPTQLLNGLDLVGVLCGV